MPIAHVVVTIILCLNALSAYAQSDVQAVQADVSLLPIDHGQGLISYLPAVEKRELAERVKGLRSGLQSQRLKIIDAIQESQFDSKDTLITLLMPGGLIYASHKKLTHEKAKHELGLVENQLDDLAMDLLMLETIKSPMTIAMVP